MFEMRERDVPAKQWWQRGQRMIWDVRRWGGTRRIDRKVVVKVSKTMGVDQRLPKVCPEPKEERIFLCFSTATTGPPPLLPSSTTSLWLIPIIPVLRLDITDDGHRHLFYHVAGRFLHPRPRPIIVLVSAASTIPEKFFIDPNRRSLATEKPSRSEDYSWGVQPKQHRGDLQESTAQTSLVAEVYTGNGSKARL